jgi:MFS family permease
LPVTPGYGTTLRMWLAAWPLTVVFMLSNAPSPLYVLWQRDIGFSSGTLSVIFATYVASAMVTLLVAGQMSDRIGRKPVLLPTFALAIVSCIVFATADSVIALLVGRVLAGITTGVFVAVGVSAVMDIGGPARARRAAFAASIATVLGFGAGPLLAGVLAETVGGPTSTVFIVEIVLLATAIPVVIALPLGRPVPVHGQTRWVRLPSVPRVSRQHVALAVSVYAPGIGAASFMLSLAPSLLADQLGTDNRAVAGVGAFIVFAFGSVTQLALRGLRIRTALLVAAACSATSMVAVVLAVAHSSLWIMAIGGLLAGAGQSMSQLGAFSLINLSAPRGRLAECNAAVSFGGYAASGIFPLLGGYVSASFGLRVGATVFGFTVAALAVAGFAAVWVWRRAILEHR